MSDSIEIRRITNGFIVSCNTSIKGKFMEMYCKDKKEIKSSVLNLIDDLIK